MTPLLQVRNVSKSFTSGDGKQRTPVLADVSFTVGEREIVALIGASGTGKTTVLRLVAGLTKPDVGGCFLEKREITRPSPDVAMVFQLFSLLPWRTALQNVAFPLELRRFPRHERLRRAAEYLDLVGLREFAQYRPFQLSGGMQQRVGLARALATEPRVLLLDEPFGSLDQQTAERLRDELLRIHDRVPTGAIIVTHNIDEAIYLAHKIVVLAGSPARVTRTFLVDLPPRRWEHDVHASPTFARLRTELKQELLPDLKSRDDSAGEGE